MTTESPKLLKKSDVCARLNLSARCLEGMVSSERFPPGVMLGKFVYWSERTIDAWLLREFGQQESWNP